MRKEARIEFTAYRQSPRPFSSMQCCMTDLTDAWGPMARIEEIESGQFVAATRENPAEMQADTKESLGVGQRVLEVWTVCRRSVRKATGEAERSH